jgi:hypothetical protein
MGLDRGYANFRKNLTGEVRRTPLLGSWVNRRIRTLGAIASGGISAPPVAYHVEHHPIRIDHEEAPHPPTLIS